jgi:hypothetical protein
MNNKEPVKHNPVAQDLRTPKYRMRVIKKKTLYDRKKVLINKD